MKCTKCNGSGSEGFISFLRCGRCGGSGDEPKDALVPYSDELIVIPKEGVLAETAKLQKKQEEPEKKIEEAAAVAEEAVAPVRQARYPRYGYGMPPVGMIPPRAPEAPKKAESIHSTHVFPVEIQPQATHSLTLSCYLLYELMGSKNPMDFDIHLRKIRFGCEGKYIVSFSYLACQMFTNFYTGLGVDAKPLGECKVNPMRNEDLSFTLQSFDDNVVKDNIFLTLFFEITVIRPHIYTPCYAL